MQAYSSEHLRPQDPIEIAVILGEVEKVHFTLSRGASLKGKVIDDQGSPMKAVTVRARSLTDRRGGGRAKTKDDGSFAMAGMRPGRYRVSAAVGLWGRQALRAPGTGDDEVQGEVVQIRDGESSELTLVVQSQSGTISGVVVDESGKAVSDAFVDSERQSDAAGAAKSGALISAR